MLRLLVDLACDSWQISKSLQHPQQKNCEGSRCPGGDSLPQRQGRGALLMSEASSVHTRELFQMGLEVFGHRLPFGTTIQIAVNPAA